MNILIIEDEVPAYKKLLNYIINYFGSDFTHTHIRSVAEGVTALAEPNTYNLIFADIKILNGTSFDIFNQVEFSTPIIFCTAFDEHLLKAFQTNGIAYILKPYSQEELDEAINKFKALFQTQPHDKDLFQRFKLLLENNGNLYKKRFTVKKKQGIKLIEVENICLIEAYGNLCKLYDENGKFHTITKSIGALHNELSPNHFFKVNRSQIIHIKYIENIAPHSKNRLYVKIKNIKNSVITSSSITKGFRVWLEH